MSYIVCIYDYGGLIFIVNKMFCLSFMAITNRKFSPDVTQQIKKAPQWGVFLIGCATWIVHALSHGAPLKGLSAFMSATNAAGMNPNHNRGSHPM